MKKTEIEKKAEAYFKKNKDVDQLFATSDGQLFVNKNSRDLHKNSNPQKKKLEGYTFDRGVKKLPATPPNDDGGETPMQKGKREVKELKAKIATATKEELDVIETAENGGKKRTSITKEISARKEELAPIVPNGGAATDAARKEDDKDNKKTTEG